MYGGSNDPNSKANLSLYDSLRVGYLGNENKQGQEMAKYGYQIDKGLSNDNQQVYYNPESKKLLYNVTGSHNLTDWVNSDLKLALGIRKNEGKPIIERALKNSSLNHGRRVSTVGTKMYLVDSKIPPVTKKPTQLLKKQRQSIHPPMLVSQDIHLAAASHRTFQRKATQFMSWIPVPQLDNLLKVLLIATSTAQLVT
jgi:hypothetical protein